MVCSKDRQNGEQNEEKKEKLSGKRRKDISCCQWDFYDCNFASDAVSVLLLHDFIRQR